MSKNQFCPLDDLPNEEELKKIVPNMTFKKITNNELPSQIKNNGLVKECNSFIAAASGSLNGTLYSFIGIRPDKGNVIDEHPFVFYYDHNDASNNFGGIINHGNWSERTIPMEQKQIDAMTASGITANFTYKTVPFGSTGSLMDLKKNGILDGISTQFDILMKNNPK